jgi:DNA repair exonuclease SbcCD ATPase subunit
VTPYGTRSPIVQSMRRGGTWLAATGALVALAGCGGGGDARPEEPRLPRAVAERLAQESEAIADMLDAGDTCGAAEQADVLEDAVEEAIGNGDVPEAFQAELLETARQLQNDVNCPQPPPPPEQDCDALEEEKKALEEQKKASEEQKNDAEGEEKQQLEEQIKALDEQIKALEEQIKDCKEGDGGDD